MDTVIVTSSRITALEPQQNPVLVFSITLMQKRVCPPVWIRERVLFIDTQFSILYTSMYSQAEASILVLHAELSSVRVLLVKGLYHSNLPSTLELVDET